MEKVQVYYPAKSGKFIDGREIEIPIDADFVKRKFLDLQYAKGSERRKLDIYLPNEGSGPYPVIVDIYGGAWCFGNKSSFKMEPAMQLLKRGFAVVSPNYTLATEAPFPTQIYEIKAAIRYIRAHSEEYKLDAERIALMGESAGAHLAALSAVSSTIGFLEQDGLGNEEYESNVQAVIALYCPSDLGKIDVQFKILNMKPDIQDNTHKDSPLGVFLGNVNLKDIPDTVQKASPISYVNEKCPPFLFLHGTEDRTVPYLQSLDFAVKLAEKIGNEKVEHYLFPKAEHSIFDFESEEIYDIEENFLKKHLS